MTSTTTTSRRRSSSTTSSSTETSTRRSTRQRIITPIEKAAATSHNTLVSLLDDSSTMPEKVKRVLLVDFSDSTGASFLREFPPKHEGGYPAPISIVGSYNSLASLGTACIEWSRLGINSQKQKIAEYEAFSFDHKSELRKQKYLLEKKQRDIIKSLYQSRESRTNMDAIVEESQRNITAEIGSTQQASSAWVGLFEPENVRIDEVARLVAIAKEKKKGTPRDQGHPATNKNLLLHISALNALMKEIETCPTHLFQQGRGACNSVAIHLQDVEWTKKAGSGSSRSYAQGKVQTLDDIAKTSTCRIVVTAPSREFAKKAVNVAKSAFNGDDTNYELIVMTNKVECEKYITDVDDRRRE